MIPLLIDENDGRILFFLNIIDLDEAYLDAEVFEALAWELASGTKPPNPTETTLYLTAWIKWDGDSHITFGEIENKLQDGYINLGGKKDWETHNKLMTALYKYASEAITNFDRSEKPD